MKNPVGWFEIYVQDMQRAKAFYENTFETKLEKLPTEIPEFWAFPMDSEATGCPGALVKYEGKDSGTGGTIVYFKCADCAVEAARAKHNGGKVLRDKMSVGDYGFICLVHDTEGNMIGLHSLK
jgi:predicted enzyme related to lactoylglutathione lyase